MLQTMGDDLTLLGEWEAIMTAERMLSRVFVPVDPTVDQMQSGPRYIGNSVSPHPGPHAIALIGTRR